MNALGYRIILLSMLPTKHSKINWLRTFRTPAAIILCADRKRYTKNIIRVELYVCIWSSSKYTANHNTTITSTMYAYLQHKYTVTTGYTILLIIVPGWHVLGFEWMEQPKISCFRESSYPKMDNIMNLVSKPHNTMLFWGLDKRKTHNVMSCTHNIKKWTHNGEMITEPNNGNWK
jgi:hypothetical protein